MASNQNNEDVVGFTRIFVLFCVLVLLPSLLMSGFGIVAIVDANDDAARTASDDTRSVLRRAENALRETLWETDVAARRLSSSQAAADVARLRARGLPVGTWTLFSAAGQVIATDADDGDTLLRQRLWSTAETTEGASAHANIGGRVVSLLRQEDGRVLVYTVDDDRLRASIAAPTPKSPSKMPCHA
jgi:glycerophosphoryl diester phosphodiesterase